jgi:hypothetical protein
MTEVPKQEPEFRLDLSDRQSPTWVKLKKHLQDRRDVLRRKNDNPNLDLTQTAVLRGSLREISNLLALGEPGPGLMVADEEQGE